MRVLLVGRTLAGGLILTLASCIRISVAEGGYARVPEVRSVAPIHGAKVNLDFDMAGVEATLPESPSDLIVPSLVALIPGVPVFKTITRYPTDHLSDEDAIVLFFPVDSRRFNALARKAVANHAELAPLDEADAALLLDVTAMEGRTYTSYVGLSVLGWFAMSVVGVPTKWNSYVVELDYTLTSADGTVLRTGSSSGSRLVPSGSFGLFPIVYFVYANALENYERVENPVGLALLEAIEEALVELRDELERLE